MNVGFYFHVPFSTSPDGTIRVPSPMGTFIAEIARQAGHTTFYGHHHAAAVEDDFALPADIVTTIDLGPVRSSPARTFNPSPSLKAFRPADDGVDVMLVQGASALLPHLIRRADVPSAIFLVADYSTWRPQEHFPWWRNQLIRTWTTVYTEQQKRATAGHVVLLQDPSLARSVRRPAEQHVVFTPSISEASLREWDAHQRPSRDPHAPFTLLYSGRIVREKGIFEAVTAVSLLSSKQIENRLWVMGWEEHGSGMIDALVRHADALGVRDRVEILGYQHGVDLLDRYALADVCVIPTYWESFPRSAHEAMVLGLPLVSTNIGGMPYYVRDGDTALLVEPRDAVGLASAVERLARDDAFRARVASSGREWARQHTLEAACREFVQILSRLAPAAVS